jgi:hypothetical protein
MPRGRPRKNPLPVGKTWNGTVVATGEKVASLPAIDNRKDSTTMNVGTKKLKWSDGPDTTVVYT